MVSTVDSNNLNKSPRSNNNEHGGGTSMTRALRAALVLIMFVMVILQFRLSLDKFYSLATPCHVSFLEDFYSPLAALKNASTTTEAERDSREVPSPKLPHVISSPLPQNGLHQPGSKVLPEINHMGMLIFYLHIPKTGGKFNNGSPLPFPNNILTSA
jgi:hypothetical protein